MRRIITRTSTACALCCALTALPAGPAVADGNPRVPPDGIRVDDGKGNAEVRAAKRAVDRIYRLAAINTLQYEAARKGVRKQRRTVARLRRSVRVEQRRLDAVRAKLGRLAAEQYRDGGLGGTAQLMLVSKPRDFLDGLLLMDRGRQAVGRLYTRAEDAERRTEARKRRADRALAQLDREVVRQRRLKKTLDARLARAERRLMRLQGRGAVAAKARGEHCETGPKHTAYVGDGLPLGQRKWLAPVRKYRLTARFGQSSDHWSQRHTGLDFAVPAGRRVTSAGYGTVYALGCGDAFGNSVTIKHDDGYYTFYAHLSRITARPGRRVFPGEPIGLAGSTGNSTGPHLHFEVRVTPEFGSGIDPLPWLKARGVDPVRQSTHHARHR